MSEGWTKEESQRRCPHGLKPTVCRKCEDKRAQDTLDTLSDVIGVTEWDPPECKVCGAQPREPDGAMEHGRGCYVRSEDGGGTTFAERVPGSDPTIAEVREAIQHSGVFDRQRSAWFARRLLRRLEQDVVAASATTVAVNAERERWTKRIKMLEDRIDRAVAILRGESP